MTDDDPLLPLCPFCHYELDVENASCGNCGAELPRKGVPFYVKLRTLGITGLTLFIAAVILDDCVINYLPGGRDSGFTAITSPQQPLGPGPDMKSPQLQALLQAWLYGQTQSQNPPTTGAIKR